MKYTYSHYTQNHKVPTIEKNESLIQFHGELKIYHEEYPNLVIKTPAYRTNNYGMLYAYSIILPEEFKEVKHPEYNKCWESENGHKITLIYGTPEYPAQLRIN